LPRLTPIAMISFQVSDEVANLVLPSITET
jgi:hypothetical protein